jgi:hypothetical protein
MIVLAKRSVSGTVSAAVCAAVLAAPSTALAVTVDTEIGDGIGTSVPDVFGDGSNVAVDTSITSVTYEEPVLVNRHGLRYYEVLGTVEGVGWGGEFQDLEAPPPPQQPPPPEPAFSHYSYSMPFVLRWAPDWDGTLVHYQHGFSSLRLSVRLDAVLGNDNEARRFDIAEGGYVSDVVVDNPRKHAFFAINLSGLGRNGEFTAIAAEGPFEGMPLNASVDVPITRDMSQVAERLLMKLSQRAVERTIGTGHSGGALITQFMASNRGLALLAGIPLLDGGNFRTAYDPSSGTIFEGIIPLAGGDILVNPAFPLTAKAIMIGGETDYSNTAHVIYADRLLRNGVDLNADVRIYFIRNLPHAFAEIVESTPNGNRAFEQLFGFAPEADAEHLRPVVAAAIDNMVDWLVAGRPPPRSFITGQPIDEDDDGVPDRIAFSRADGSTTSVVPYVEDPTIDEFFGEVFEFSTDQVGTAVVRYAEVLEALDHESDALSLPQLQCRVGGYSFEADAVLVPFPDLSAHWKNFGRYKSCVEHAISDLSRMGVYDKKIGKHVVFTEEILSLFGR